MRIAAARPTSPFAAALLATRRAFVFVAIFTATINLLFLTVPLYMMQLFDRVLPSRSLDTLLYLSLIAGAGVLLHAVLDYLRLRLLGSVVAHLDRVLGPEAFGRSVASSLRGHSYATEGMRDLATIRGFLGSVGVCAIFDAPWTILYILVMYLVHPALGGLAAGGAVLMMIVALATEFVTRRPLREASVAQMRAMRRVEAANRNAEVITAMGMMPQLTRLWSAESAEVLSHQERAAGRTSMLLATTKFLRLTLQLAIIGAGCWLVVQQELTAGAMLAASLIFGRALGPVEQALGAWRGFVMARAAYERVSQFFGEGAGAATSMQLPVPRGRLQVERLTYATPGSDRLIIKGVGFELQPGQALAIIGPSGAGKSTLARLLVGLLKPTAGHVRLDSADVWLWDRVELGRWVGFVPQDVELFSGTIAQNIARMTDGDPEEVVRSAQIADVHDLILRMPRGYDTDIGEGGALLSAGQRQRIALARAVYGRPRFLVLDEPNSNLDHDGEQALPATIERLKSDGCTLVIVTHRQSLLSAVDKVVVLREGVVMLSGERNAVLERLQKGGGPSIPPQPAETAKPVGQAKRVRPVLAS